MFILFLQRFLQIIKITVIIKSNPSTIAKTITAANAPSIVDANSAPIITPITSANNAPTIAAITSKQLHFLHFDFFFATITVF